MEKQTLLIIGLIGGILATIGVFLPWASWGYEWSEPWSESGWGLRGEMNSPYLALAGGIIALLGGFALLKGKRPVGFLLPMGGIIAIAGGAWGYFDVSAYLSQIEPGAFELFSGFDYGFYVCTAGGILALIGGALSLKAE